MGRDVQDNSEFKRKIYYKITCCIVLYCSEDETSQLTIAFVFFVAFPWVCLFFLLIRDLRTGCADGIFVKLFSSVVASLASFWIGFCTISPADWCKNCGIYSNSIEKSLLKNISYGPTWDLSHYSNYKELLHFKYGNEARWIYLFPAKTMYQKKLTS